MGKVASKPLKADPGVGDPRAPIGSEAWAQHVRLSLEAVVGHLHDEPERLGRYLDVVMEKQAWLVLNKPDGTYFATFEEFCSHPKPYGLGLAPGELARRLSLATSGQRVKALFANPKAQPIETTLTIEQAKALPVHPAAALLPMLDEGNLARLVADIAEHGLRNPLTLFEGQLLDGRNRLAACERAGVEPRAVTLAECDLPARYVLSVNLHRRHLTDSQKAAAGVAADEMDRIEEERRRNSLANLRQGSEAPDRADLPSREPGRSRDDLAALVGTSGRLVQCAKTVKEQGAPELFEAVKRGDVTASAAATIVTLPHEEQKAHVEAGTVKHAAKQIREAKKAERAGKTPKPSDVQTSSAPVNECTSEQMHVEAPDACLRCGGTRFRDASEKTHDGQTIRRWVCTNDACGHVEKPKPNRKREARSKARSLLDTISDDLIERALAALEAIAQGEAA